MKPATVLRAHVKRNGRILEVKRGRPQDTPYTGWLDGVEVCGAQTVDGVVWLLEWVYKDRTPRRADET